MLADGWLEEKFKSSSFHPTNLLLVPWKSREWIESQRSDDPPKLMLHATENMAPCQPFPRNKLGELALFEKEWLMRYMSGPWKDDEFKVDVTNKNELLERDVYKNIFEIRKEIAEKQNVAPVHVCSRQELNDICNMRPTSEACMVKIEGMTKVKVACLQPMLSFFKKCSSDDSFETDLHESVEKSQDTQDNQLPNIFPVSMIFSLKSKYKL